ncbi:MAG TPA: hypothetical protein VGX51_08170 [Solirubrobacteraceae bacterium]|nr:hypothetical protein [Solirubrobacteraceae bacterium]
MSTIRSRTTRVAGVALFAAILAALILPGGALANSSLWQLPGTAPQPGPPLLYEPPAAAPQLENAPGSTWHASPLLVSGAGAYREGEYLYQGYVYDDHGAKEVADPSNPITSNPEDRSGGDLFSAPDGTYDYPSGLHYDENAANLIEFRVKRVTKATAFRVTLNTLEDPNLVATAIAVGGTEGQSHPFPFGANVSAPAQFFITIHGHTAVMTNAVTGKAIAPAPTVSVDLLRRQITVVVSRKAWKPPHGRKGKANVRLAAAVGLWNNATGKYLLPGGERTATTPGGAGKELSNPPAFYDVAFRFNAQEPLPGTPESEATSNPAWWRERAQAEALAAGDISKFHAVVDFSKLNGNTTLEQPNAPTGVPTTGAFDRILAGRYSFGQGANYLTGGCGKKEKCIGEMQGQLQPYAIYVPTGAAPAGGYGLTLLLHSLSANYNQFEGSHNQSQFAGHGGAASIVITPSGRGPDGWYYDHAGANVFETWADVAAHYSLNPAFTDVAGYSMGGYGTYKFASQFPDLFAKAQPTVGPPALGIWAPPAEPTGGEATLTQRMLASVRNIPFLIWDEKTDELVPIAGVKEQVKKFDELGYRYEFDEFQAGDHLTLAINDEFAPAAAFLGTDTVNPDPPHVTYTYNPQMDFAADGTTAGHAYWVYGVQLRANSGENSIGTIDVRSEGFGVGDAPANATEKGAGALNGKEGKAPIPYISETKTWGSAPSAPVSDTLDIKAENIGQVTIDAKRAHVDCSPHLNITSDGPLTVSLADC